MKMIYCRYTDDIGKMREIALFTVCLYCMKSLASSSVVGRDKYASNQWLQPFVVITSPITNWFGSEKNPAVESLANDEEPLEQELQVLEEAQSPKKFSDLLDVLRAEVVVVSFCLFFFGIFARITTQDERLIIDRRSR